MTERGAKITQCSRRETDIKLWLAENGPPRLLQALEGLVHGVRDVAAMEMPVATNLTEIDHTTGLKPVHMETLVARCRP